ncbi:MAG: hypothetical protein RJB60_2385 [Pseudomonadota bacterium]|jgi:hypothetical protein
MLQERSTFAPCSLDELRNSMLALYVHHLRQSNLLTSDKHWPLAHHPNLDPRAVWDTNLKFSEVGVTFADIQSSSFVSCMEQQYQYGVNGVIAAGKEPLEYETQHTWVAALLMDWASSQFVEEWESYGADLRSHAQRCLLVSELANARLVLEGAEMGFSHFAMLGSKDQDATEFDGLTIHQMALLSGLEEMSVRTAASRKGPSQLITQKNSKGRTIVSREQAKAWLQARSKYLVVTRETEELRLDLSSMSFDNLILLSNALYEQCSWLGIKHAKPDLDREVGMLFAKHGFNPTWCVNDGAEACEPLLRELATTLELPVELFLLRVKESALHEQLNAVETSLKQRAQPAA